MTGRQVALNLLAFIELVIVLTLALERNSSTDNFTFWAFILLVLLVMTSLSLSLKPFKNARHIYRVGFNRKSIAPDSKVWVKLTYKGKSRLKEAYKHLSDDMQERYKRFERGDFHQFTLIELIDFFFETPLFDEGFIEGEKIYLYDPTAVKDVHAPHFETASIRPDRDPNPDDDGLDPFLGDRPPFNHG